MVSVAELTAAGAVRRQGPAALFPRAVVDSREVGAGDLFVALPGSHTDGERYWAQAVARGAAGIFGRRWPLPAAEERPAPPPEVAVLTAPRPEEVLWRVAQGRLSGVRRRTVAVTGSVGKTTTKEFAATLIGRRWRTFRSEGNRNTEIGLPLSLLEMPPDREALVVEMAMRGPGQIATLARWVGPQVGVITGIGVSHIGELGSREAIARAKGELLEALPEDGVAILPAADPFTPWLSGRARCPVWRVGLEGEGERAPDLVARQLAPAPEGGIAFRLRWRGEEREAHLPLVGEHLLRDALLAVAAALALEVPLAEAAAGLEAVQVAPGRSRLLKVGGVRLLDDAYNASPDSLRAALATLSQLAPPGARWAVIGEMRELGAFASELHRQVGAEAGRAGLAGLVVVGGEEARGLAEAAQASGLDPRRLLRVADASQAVDALWRLGPPRPGEAVLIKGAHALGLEATVAALARRLVEEAQP